MFCFTVKIYAYLFISLSKFFLYKKMMIILVVTRYLETCNENEGNNRAIDNIFIL